MDTPCALPLFVEVSVPLPIDHPFTYRVPPGQQARAQVGVRVLAPVGRRKVTGLITAPAAGSPAPSLPPRQRKVYGAVLGAGEISSPDLSALVPGGSEVARRLAAKGILAGSVRGESQPLSAPRPGAGTRARAMAPPRQLWARVRPGWGEGAAVLHSGLTRAERASQWRRIRAGEVFLCIGARSAVFSPFSSPGLFIVDEGLDSAYKQEEGD